MSSRRELISARQDSAQGTATFPLPTAVMWDMDGTLVDTEPYWIAAETELVEAHGRAWTYEDGLSLVGNSLPASALVLQSAGVRLGIPEIIDALLDRVIARVATRVPWRPGAYELLGALRDARVPCALVTMSYRSLARAIVEQAPAGVFSAVVCGDDVRLGKPDPEPYLLAARQLGVEPGRCVAVEDSPAGIASARAAGAATLGIEAVVPVVPAPGLSRAPSLEQVDLALFARLAAGQVVDLIA